MNFCRFSVQVCKTPQDYAEAERSELVLIEGLVNNILKHLGNVELGRPIKIFARNPENRVVGGITANAFGGWVYISLLWVDESCRNQGIGTQLLNQMEQEAIRLGCKHGHVDTYNFEAKPFYQRAGYEVFAVLEDYPAGHQKFFLKKDFP
jgi:GNAT superfamily N-acetyltransferase